jgi:hypothetical protein
MAGFDHQCDAITKNLGSGQNIGRVMMDGEVFV